MVRPALLYPTGRWVFSPCSEFSELVLLLSVQIPKNEKSLALYILDSIHSFLFYNTLLTTLDPNAK